MAVRAGAPWRALLGRGVWGGVVAGVEISIDGGATWHPATGTSAWSYTWTPTTSTVSVETRASDDSLNTEKPSDLVTLSIGPGADTLSLFSSTTIPAIVTTDDHEALERVQEALSSGEREWIEVSRGLGREKVVANGVTAEGTNELLIRNQHKAWLGYMTGAL